METTNNTVLRKTDKNLSRETKIRKKCFKGPFHNSGSCLLGYIHTQKSSRWTEIPIVTLHLAPKFTQTFMFTDSDECEGRKSWCNIVITDLWSPFIYHFKVGSQLLLRKEKHFLFPNYHSEIKDIIFNKIAKWSKDCR